MANISISQMESAAAVSNDDLFEVAVPDSGSATGYNSKKQSMGAIAGHIGNDVAYTGLTTNDDSLVGAINEIFRTENGTATRNTTNAATGTCAYYRYGKLVIVALTGCTMTEDAANNSVMFSGLPTPAAQTNFIVYGSTSGTTRWYVDTTGEMKIGAKALSGQTIVSSFCYISTDAPSPPSVGLMMSMMGGGGTPTLQQIEQDEQHAQEGLNERESR